MWEMYSSADRSAKMTLIGASLMKFAGGLSLIWGSCNIYFFSFLKHQGEHIDTTTNSKLLLWALLPLLVTVPIANPFARWVGYQNAIRICAVIFLLSPLVINLAFNLQVFTIFWMIIPITCFCMSGIPLINCLWTQFPKDLNKVSGVAILMFSVGMIFWNLLFMGVVNPDNASATVDQSGLPIFGEQVANNIFKASNLVFGIAGTINIIGSFLVRKRNKVTVIQQPLRPAPSEYSMTPQLSHTDDALVGYQRAISRLSQKKLSQNKAAQTPTLSLKQGLFDKRFILIFFISGLNPIYLVYIMQNIKLIYMPIINDDHFLSYCAAIVTLSAVVGAPLWGCIGDMKGFKLTFLLICIVDSVVKGFGVGCEAKWSLALLFFGLGANDRGLLTVVGPGLISIFGIQMATQLIPYKGLALIFSYVTAPIIQIFLAQLSHHSLLCIFFGCSLLGVILAAYLNFRVHYKQVDPTAQLQEAGHQLKQRNLKDTDF